MNMYPYSYVFILRLFMILEKKTVMVKENGFFTKEVVFRACFLQPKEGSVSTMGICRFFNVC